MDPFAGHERRPLVSNEYDFGQRRYAGRVWQSGYQLYDKPAAASVANGKWDMAQPHDGTKRRSVRNQPVSPYVSPLGWQSLQSRRRSRHVVSRSFGNWSLDRRADESFRLAFLRWGGAIWKG